MLPSLSVAYIPAVATTLLSFSVAYIPAVAITLPYLPSRQLVKEAYMCRSRPKLSAAEAQQQKKHQQQQQQLDAKKQVRSQRHRQQLKTSSSCTAAICFCGGAVLLCRLCSCRRDIPGRSMKCVYRDQSSRRPKLSCRSSSIAEQQKNLSAVSKDATQELPLKSSSCKNSKPSAAKALRSSSSSSPVWLTNRKWLRIAEPTHRLRCLAFA